LQIESAFDERPECGQALASELGQSCPCSGQGLPIKQRSGLKTFLVFIIVKKCFLLELQSLPRTVGVINIFGRTHASGK
jgi:hypothetical protein